MRKLKILAVLNAVCFIVANVISYLSNTGVFAGQTIADVSKKYEALFVPAGFTFAIWGVIYAALYAFVIYHLLKAFKKDMGHEANMDLAKLGWLFAIDNVATAAWVIAWVNEELVGSAVLIVIQLITLILMNIRLGIYDPNRSAKSRLFTQFPLAIYFAWICIATIANVSSSLYGLGWDGGIFSAQIWTVILISAATILSILIIFGLKDIFFGLVVIWALFGIMSKRSQEGPEAYSLIVFSTQIGIVLIALAIAFQLARNLKGRNFRLNSNV